MNHCISAPSYRAGNPLSLQVDDNRVTVSWTFSFFINGRVIDFSLFINDSLAYVGPLTSHSFTLTSKVQSTRLATLFYFTSLSIQPESENNRYSLYYASCNHIVVNSSRRLCNIGYTLCAQTPCSLLSPNYLHNSRKVALSES